MLRGQNRPPSLLVRAKSLFPRACLPGTDSVLRSLRMKQIAGVKPTDKVTNIVSKFEKILKMFFCSWMTHIVWFIHLITSWFNNYTIITSSQRKLRNIMRKITQKHMAPSNWLIEILRNRFLCNKHFSRDPPTPRGIDRGNWITACNNDLLTFNIVCENKKNATNFRENSNFCWLLKNEIFVEYNS